MPVFRPSAFATILVLALSPVNVSGCVAEASVEGLLCSPERRCPKGFGCIGGRCRAVPDGVAVRCHEDVQCPVGRCHEDVGFCVQCTAADDCPVGVCLEDAFVCGCARHDDCRTGRCELETGICLSCFTDLQCESGRCGVETGYCEKKSDEEPSPLQRSE